jgi:hypothetical protein
MFRWAPSAPGPSRAVRGPRQSCTTTYSAAVGPTGNTGLALAVGATRRRMHISAPPAPGPARGPRAASGPEELRDSERSHGCRRDAATVCFQSLPQIMVDDSTRSVLAQLRIGPWNHTVEPVAPSIKANGEETRQSINAQIVCESHRHSLFSRWSTAAAGTVCGRLPWSQDAV